MSKYSDEEDRAGHRPKRPRREDEYQSRSYKDKSDRHSSRQRRSLSPRDSDRRKRHGRDSYRDRSRSRSPKAFERSRGGLPSQDAAFKHEQNPDEPIIEKEKPNWKPTGRLAAASNTVQTANQTIVLKYHEPAEARKPPAKDPWRMYVFKDDEIVDTIQLFEQSCWLFGREIAVTDVPIEHPSCSKQHAVVQFRYIEKRNEFGDKIGKVKPYALDLESSNGTFVNGERIEDARYVELRDKDVVKFGHSKREYVIQLPKDG